MVHESFERLDLHPPFRSSYTIFAYGLWNVAVSGVPFFRPREAPTGESPYRHVREESHRSPRLPSVKELSDDIGDFYS